VSRKMTEEEQQRENDRDIPRQYGTDVDMASEFLQFCGGSPPTSASMEAFKPTKYPLEHWQSFCGEPWSYTLHILRKAGCSDFSGLQQEVLYALQQDGGGYSYSRRASYGGSGHDDDDDYDGGYRVFGCASRDSSLRQIFQDHRNLRRYINKNICAARSIDPVRLIVANEKMRQVHEVKLRKEDDDEDRDRGGRGGGEEEVAVGELLIDCAFEDITKMYDPVLGEVRWHMRLVNSNEDRNIRALPDDGVTIRDLFDTLVEDNLLFKHTSYGREVLSSVLEAYEHYGLVKCKTEIGPEGFFFVDGKLEASKVKVRDDITKTEAVDAVNTIRDLQSKFYKRLVEHHRLAHVLKWAVQAPFDYAKRQLHLENNILPRVDMAGRPDTGKTYGYARLPLVIFGKSLDDVHLVGAGSVETAPRFIQKTGKTTFPIILDEVDFLVNAGKDDRVSHILSVIKNQVALTHPREVLTKDGDVDVRPSFSPPILTHNSDALREEGSQKRFVPFLFTEHDIKSKEEQQEFEKFIAEHKDRLKIVGDFAISYVMKNPDVLRKSWIDTGKEIWRALYALAEEKYPESWLDLVIANDSISDVGEHRRVMIRAILLGEVNRAWSANRHGIKSSLSGATTESYDFPDPELKEKISLLLQHKLLPTMRVHQIGGVCLLSPTIDLLKKGGLDRISMPQLADLTGFEYKQQKINGKNTKGVCTNIDAFTEFLEY
jgi:hypothetical protein